MCRRLRAGARTATTPVLLLTARDGGLDRVRASSVTVELRVADDGAGIDADDLPHVFERLYVGRPAARRATGSGLGLAIVAELVDATGGTVTAATENGTTMTVRLPL